MSLSPDTFKATKTFQNNATVRTAYAVVLTHDLFCDLGDKPTSAPVHSESRLFK